MSSIRTHLSHRCSRNERKRNAHRNGCSTFILIALPGCHRRWTHLHFTAHQADGHRWYNFTNEFTNFRLSSINRMVNAEWLALSLSLPSPSLSGAINSSAQLKSQSNASIVKRATAPNTCGALLMYATCDDGSHKFGLDTVCLCVHRCAMRAPKCRQFSGFD